MFGIGPLKGLEDWSAWFPTQLSNHSEMAL